MVQLRDQIDKQAERISETMRDGNVPFADRKAMELAYQQLSERLGEDNLLVSVRSSATAEDLPTASFAGQQSTFLGQRGIDRVRAAAHKCNQRAHLNRKLRFRGGLWDRNRILLQKIPLKMGKTKQRYQNRHRILSIPKEVSFRSKRPCIFYLSALDVSVNESCG